MKGKAVVYHEGMKEAHEVSPTGSRCLGLPWTGSRELSPEEVAEVRREARATLRRVARSLALLIALPVALFLLLLLPIPKWTWLRGILETVAFLGLLVAPAFLLLHSRDLLRLWYALRRDARLGRVNRFEGRSEVTFPFPDEEDPDLSLFERGSAHILEILPRSGWLFRLDGQKPQRWTRLGIDHMAPAGSHNYPGPDDPPQPLYLRPPEK